VCAGDEAGDVEEFYGDGARALLAGAVVGFTSALQWWGFGGGGGGVAGEGGSRAGAWDVEVAYRAVGVDGSEGEVACWSEGRVRRLDDQGLRQAGAPTLAVVSVKLFKVDDLPEDGLPTRAMRGSRGIFLMMKIRLECRDAVRMDLAAVGLIDCLPKTLSGCSHGTHESLQHPGPLLECKEGSRASWSSSS